MHVHLYLHVYVYIDIDIIDMDMDIYMDIYQYSYDLCILISCWYSASQGNFNWTFRLTVYQGTLVYL